jgi:SAM-dependent methyltransferase
MVALAKASYPDIAFHEGDAESLQFEDRSFDAVVMNLGLHHIAHPEGAIAEAARVLRAEGRLAFTVWASPRDSIAHRIVFDAVRAHGRLDVIPEGPPMFRFSDAEDCQNVCAAAGLSGVTVRTLELIWEVPAPHGLIEAGQAGGVRLAMVLDAQTKDSLRSRRRCRRHAPAMNVTVDSVCQSRSRLRRPSWSARDWALYA